MRIATWNVNALRARLDFVRHWLDARRPDIVGFQELKLTEEQFPHEAFEAAGYKAVLHAQKGWNGVAILAREPLEATQRGLPGEEDFGARLITARVAEIELTTVYCPNGKTLEHADYPRKLAWFESLRRYLDERQHAARPYVLCGDFNVCPEPIDSWNEEKLGGHIHHTDEERSRFRSLLDWGLQDLFRNVHPDEQKFSWWDYRGGAFHRKLGLRIDFLLGTEPLAERVRSVEIDRDYRKKKEGMIPSDHAPVIADLE